MIKSYQKKTFKISLRLVLIVPFILLIFTTVALVGYLSYLNGKKAVENLANQLMDQSANRIYDHLNNSVTSQQAIVKINANLVQQNLLNINDNEALKKYLWQQIKMTPNLANTLFLDQDQNLIGYYRMRSQEIVNKINQLSGKNYVKFGTLIFGEMKFKQAPKHKFYLVDNQGEKIRLLFQLPIDQNYWLFNSFNTKKQVWLPILINQSIKIPELAAVFPLYNSQSQIKGIFLSSRLLSGISQFLQELKISQSGQSFILERSGNLVATSKAEILCLENSQGKLDRLPALKSQNPWIRKIALELNQKFPNLQNIPNHYHLKIPYHHQTLFVQVSDYQDQYGLDWLLVTVIPDTDLMKEIKANTNQTIILSILTLIISSIISIIIARWISEPILRLNYASQLLAKGNWHSFLVENELIIEMESLFHSFNWMTAKIEDSFTHLNLALNELTQLYQEREKYTQILEEKVKERTIELQLANEELSRLAHLDGLTQIANRRSFDQYLAQEWQRHLRQQQSLALILIDIDYFKLYNDYYGHHGGDDCLIKVAQTISNIPKRPTDLVARYGGEEFVVILPNTNTKGALIVAQEIQQAIEFLKIPHHESKINQYVTLSMGIGSMIPEHNLQFEDLINQADQALYSAKNNGRNQIKFLTIYN